MWGGGELVGDTDIIFKNNYLFMGEAEEKLVNLANLEDSTATIDRKILIDQKPVNQPTSAIIYSYFGFI